MRTATALTLFSVGLMSSGTPSLDPRLWLGYRFEGPAKGCLLEGQSGYNQGFLGECGGLQGVESSSLDLKDRTLLGANFSESRFESVVIRSGSMEYARAFHVHWNRPEFFDVFLDSADFSYSDLNEARFEIYSIENVNFTGTQLQGARLSGIEMKRVLFGGANLAGADFSDSILATCNFKNSNLTGANFAYVASPTDPQFGSTGPSFFRGANLSDANLTASFFAPGTHFQDVNFSRANLLGAVLRGVHLEGANLRDSLLGDPFEPCIGLCELKFADLRDATFDSRTLLPFSEEEARRRGMIRVE